MSLRMPAPKEVQPKSFKFNKANLDKINFIISKYPSDRQASALLPLLDLAQRQNNNWLPLEAMNEVAKILSIPMIKVLEVATFYSMFNLEPVGENFVQICRTTPCWLRGSDKLTKVAKEVSDSQLGETSTDNKFTIVEVECLGA